MSDIAQKFRQLETELNSRLVERSAVVRAAVTAIPAGLHLFQLGTPGTAKSLTSRQIMAHIDGLDKEYFEILFTRFTTPEEVFGPVSIKGLEQDEFRRQIEGYLPTASLVFADEVFKANSSILNSLLWALNERKYRNNGDMLDIPLISMFCASNELPQGEELEALYDRIHFRHVIKPISEPGNFIHMLKNQVAGTPTKILTLAEVRAAQVEVAQVDIPNDVFEAVNTLRMNLRKEGVEPTDRRFAECLKVIRATAWLNDRSVADIDDMRLLKHVLWTSMEEQTVVEKAVLELANPLDKEAMELLEQVEKLATELDEVVQDADNKQVRNKKGIELHGKIEKAKTELETLQSRSAKSGRKSEVLGELQTRIMSITETLLKEIFHIERPA